MDLYEAMRTNPSCRYFTDDPLGDAVLHRIFDHARFASSGGNRQGWRTIVVTDPDLKQQISELHTKQWNVYLGHARDGVVGYQTTDAQTKMASYDPAQQRLTRTDDFAKVAGPGAGVAGVLCRTLDTCGDR